MSAPDQSSCSSTRALRPDRRPGSVQITVRKLQDAPPSKTQKQKNHQRRSPRQQTGIGVPQQTAADSESGKSPRGRNQDPAQLVQKGDDVLTSRFASRGRGVALVALKKRSQSAPKERKVTVQFLETAGNPPGSPALSSQDAAGDARVQTLYSGHPGDTSNAAAAAAAAAAAVAAAAPLIKAQSDMEARVAQLADGVQKLLQADREGGDRERSLNQQTLQHLETLQSQQLQLQSQLVESAIKIASGHASSSADLTASGRLGHLQLTHLDTGANRLGTQPPSSSPGTAPPAAPVTMETRSPDRWPDQTRDSQYLRDAPRVSGAERSQLQSLANHSWEAARRANDVLQEMKRLKTEMKMLLTQPEDPLKTTRPAPDHLKSQQNQSYQTRSQENNFWSQSSHFQQNHFQSQQNQSQFQRFQVLQNQPHEKHLQKNHQSLQDQQNPSPSQLFQTSQTSDRENELWSQPSQLSQLSQSVLVQRRPTAPSLLEEAGQVLRQVRKQKKVLEENLEALLRARTGEVLQCQLEALAANREHSNEVRIKKTVDAWISRLSRDSQAETSSGNHDIHHSIADAKDSAHTGKGRPASTLRGKGSSMAARRGSRGQRAGVRVPQGLETQLEVDGESYLTRLYGRAPYDGLRRTLKKSPYLRLSSPGSPLGRKSRPRLVESVRGVKLKSCKTQTSLAPPLTQAPPLSQAQPILLAPPFASSSPGRPQIFSLSHLTSGHRGDFTMTPADSHPATMAIPLGRRRMDSSSRCDLPVDVTSPPAAPPTASVAEGAPELQEQHLDEAPPPLPPPSHSINIMEGNSGEEEQNVFPGADFLSVVDVVQQEVSVSAEEVVEAVELDGGPSPPSVLYQGPVFPPQAPSTLPAQDQRPILDIDLQLDSMEDRLVEWVEQQLMSRMISDLYHPPASVPAQNKDTDQSDLEERSVASDIVEAAGNGGLQLFVDSSVPVDSVLIRQLVNEVLTEMIPLMLGQRDALSTGPEPGQEPPESEAEAHQENKLIPLVPTPEPTPPPSPALSSREATAVTTPPPSEPTSPLRKEPLQSITAPELVATPTLSPEPAPSANETSPSAAHRAPPHFTWEDVELPLDEERQVEDVAAYKPPLLMSLAENVPPLSSDQSSPAPSSLPPAHAPSPPPEPGPASPSSSSEGSSSSSSSGSTVTAGTEATLKHISEGELLIGVKQLAAMTEGAVSSFNSSLQDMDFDPPSDGQVKGRDLLRALLAKMEQGVRQRGERPQPEGSWGREDEEVSVGEVRDDHRKASPTQRDETCSPGQISHAADMSELSFEATNQGSFTLGDFTLGEPMGTLTSDLHSELSLSPTPYLENTHNPGQVLLVRKYDRHTEGREEGGANKTDIHLPLIRPQEEEEEVMEESLSVAADSSSSANDVF